MSVGSEATSGAVGAPPQVPPSRWARLLVALAVGVLGLWYVARYNERPPELASDFDHLVRAAGMLGRGQDPYAGTGPGRANAWPWPLYYPMPALVLVWPLALLPLAAARMAFAAATAAASAYALTRRGWWTLPAFGSFAFHDAIVRGQWSPLVLAALIVPSLGGLLAAKPTVGAAVWVARPNRAALLGGLTLVAVSFVVSPSWPAGWLAAVVQSSHFRAPMTLLGGPVLLLALTRWRRPEARFLLAFACVPQTLSFYESLALFMVPASLMQSLILSLLTYFACLGYLILLPPPSPDFAAQLVLTTGVMGHLQLWLLYIPCLLMVLGRPNEGPVPAWLENLVGRLDGAVSRSLRSR